MSVEVSSSVLELALKGALEVKVGEAWHQISNEGGTYMDVMCSLVPVFSQPEPCPWCSGTGQRKEFTNWHEMVCPHCGGSGYPSTITLTTKCPECAGAGWTVVGQNWGDPYGEQAQCSCDDGQVPRLSAHLEAVLPVLSEAEWEASPRQSALILTASSAVLHLYPKSFEPVFHLREHFQIGGWAVLLSDLRPL